MRRGLLVAHAIVVALALPSPSALAGSPIDPANRPTPVAGESNGRMSPDQLIRVEGQCFTARAAAPSLARLLAASRADGVFLHSDSCYRPYERQVGSRGDACSKGRCACAGRPGGSMHGWGKAIDFRDARGSIRSTSSAGYRWLKAYGGRYGWNHPE